ncbi:hypothetical protein B0H14DRAFT_3497900 [Mycena olivaceomarginata]|nr:hypothetical protein B0H14DRAFT_3497900 [Mycena olivaceomarginata]
MMGFLWLELHLLTFEIKNQIIGLEEDLLSKPTRPIVAGRLSSAAAAKLYLFVGAFSLAWSVYHGGMSRNWFLKSFLGATRRTSATRFGDAAIGRKTLPLLLPPRIARWSLALLMATWTALLIRLWNPPHAASVLLGLLCLTSGTKFIRNHSVEADRDSYWYYKPHLLPVFTRVAAWRVVSPTAFLL